jgi:hypothetical protein
MVKRSDLEPLIIQEWLKRPRDQRTDSEVLMFYGELSQRRPDLLRFRASGDKYQHLKSILRNLIERGWRIDAAYRAVRRLKAKVQVQLPRDKRHPADYRDELEHAEVPVVLGELPEDHPARIAYYSGDRRRRTASRC